MIAKEKNTHVKSVKYSNHRTVIYSLNSYLLELLLSELKARERYVIELYR